MTLETNIYYIKAALRVEILVMPFLAIKTVYPKRIK